MEEADISRWYLTTLDCYHLTVFLLSILSVKFIRKFIKYFTHITVSAFLSWNCNARIWGLPWYIFIKPKCQVWLVLNPAVKTQDKCCYYNFTSILNLSSRSHSRHSSCFPYIISSYFYLLKPETFKNRIFFLRWNFNTNFASVNYRTKIIEPHNLCKYLTRKASRF